MFAGISGNKYIDLRPLLAIAGCFGRRVKTVITRCYPTIYLLSTGLLVLTIYIDCARAMTVPVDSLPVAAVCSTPWEEVGFADDSQFCPEDRFIPDPDIGHSRSGVVVDRFHLRLARIWTRKYFRYLYLKMMRLPRSGAKGNR